MIDLLLYKVLIVVHCLQEAKTAKALQERADGTSEGVSLSSGKYRVRIRLGQQWLTLVSGKDTNDEAAVWRDRYLVVAFGE